MFNGRWNPNVEESSVVLNTVIAPATSTSHAYHYHDQLKLRMHANIVSIIERFEVFPNTVPLPERTYAAE